MTINHSALRQWSRIGQRGIFGTALHLLGSEHENFFAMSADLGNSSGLDRFKKDFPSRYLNIGIAEQNLVGFASGLSATGTNVFISSFAPFLTMRAAEQIRVNLAHMSSNVKLVSIGAGIAMGYLGNSHFGLEDISIIRSMPNIPILAPADCFEVYQMCEFLLDYQGPAYLRLTGSAPCPIIHDIDYKFSFGSLDHLSNGTDILVLAHGAIVNSVLEAVKQANPSCHLVNVSTLRPLSDEFTELVSSFNKILVIEEHYSIGGLATIVAEIISAHNINSDLKVLALPHAYLTSGDYTELLAHYMLNTESILGQLNLLAT